MKKQNPTPLSMMPNLEAITEQNNKILKDFFKNKIKGYFLIDIKDQVMKKLGFENLIKYYNFRWSNESMITGISEATEYDICRMIVGIHRAHSIFLTDDEIRKNEITKKYKQQLVSETIEKIELRQEGSINFRKKALLLGEEFLYYPLPYELFVMSVKMSKMLNDAKDLNCGQLYYGVIYNSISVLTLMEDNLLGTAYPLCRGAIEMYLKLLALNTQTELYNQYEKFREFEIKQSCKGTYPKEFNDLFEKHICKNIKSKSAYLHFGWVDFIGEYHDKVKESPYSVYGMIAFLKDKNRNKNPELEQLENFYQSCHAYTHGSIQTAIYPVLHYFEISIMLYHIIRGTFLLLCKEKGVDAMIGQNDIISMADRDFKELYKQYENRSTENFEKYYNCSLSTI